MTVTRSLSSTLKYLIIIVNAYVIFSADFNKFIIFHKLTLSNSSGFIDNIVRRLDEESFNRYEV